jgi:hypothetical protein
MKKIEIKNRFTNDVIFTHECENNTIKITVEEAVKDGASLNRAYLDGAYLVGASLNRASLVGASLYGASLDGASLVGASLYGASLDGASLDGASLDGAYLVGASLVGAKNLDKTVKLPIYCKWTHGITNGNLIHIGCEKRTIEEWDLFFASEEIISTERNTPEFKHIQAVYESYKAYLQFLNK